MTRNAVTDVFFFAGVVTVAFFTSFLSGFFPFKRFEDFFPVMKAFYKVTQAMRVFLKRVKIWIF